MQVQAMNTLAEDRNIYNVGTNKETLATDQNVSRKQRNYQLKI